MAPSFQTTSDEMSCFLFPRAEPPTAVAYSESAGNSGTEQQLGLLGVPPTVPAP